MKKGFTKNGFTLAEILVTAAVIGIIAALTIPPIVNYYKKQQTVEELRVFYSMLTNLVQRAEDDFGAKGRWTFYTGTGTALDGKNFVETYMLPYLKYDAWCTLSNRGKCFPGNSYKQYMQPDGVTPLPSNSVQCFAGGNGVGFDGGNCNYIRLRNGGLMAVQIRGYGGNGPCNATSGGGAQIAVDINGPEQKSNMLGKDVFQDMHICANINKIYIPTSYCSKTSAYDCAGKILKDNWTIKSDYPW